MKSTLVTLGRFFIQKWNYIPDLYKKCIFARIVFLLQPYSGNTIKRIVKRPKLYFMDTGLACHLCLWNNPLALEKSAMAGAMFETYVISELVKQYSNKGLDV
ncbi:MAG: DUF4143 domain-containing protein [Bacteroidales bacterium]|nr:DUF4143 domain-containing protein [Bacteroidales bacterium]